MLGSALTKEKRPNPPLVNDAEVLLIGQRIPHNENLGLGYLLAALRRAGVPSRALSLNTWMDLQVIADQVRRQQPRLVGIAMPDGSASVLALGLGELLQATGYAGHITAGGAFATLARQWLLERYDWLDSVVRFAGEQPLVQLALSLRQRRCDPRNIAGITTRFGDGRPAPVMDTTPLEIIPDRDDLPEILGYSIAHISATRGCRGRCAYCGPAALQALERAEGKRSGACPAAMIKNSIGGVRRRSPENIAAEMATLWKDHSVRYFCFVDEQLLPAQPPAALRFLRQWRSALAARGIQRPPFSCMLRADQVTPPVLDALVNLGLARCLVGLEFLSLEERRSFGRGGDVSNTIRTIRRLERQGISTVSNAMLIHPYCTESTIQKGIDLLAGLEDIPYEAGEMQVFHGTELQQRLTAEGRLSGNPLCYEYTLDDPIAQLFADIHLRVRNAGVRSYRLAMHLRDIRLALNLAQRLRPEVPLTDLRTEIQELYVRTNRAQVECLRQILCIARNDGRPQLEELVNRSEKTAAGCLGETDRIWRTFRRRIAWRGKLFSPMAAAAATAICYVFSSGSTAVMGCTPSTGPNPTAPSAPQPTSTTVTIEPPFENQAAQCSNGDAGSADGCAATEDNDPGSGIDEYFAWAEYPGRLFPSQESGVEFFKEPLPTCPSSDLLPKAVDKLNQIGRRLAPCYSFQFSVNSLHGRVLVARQGPQAVIWPGRHQWRAYVSKFGTQTPLELKSVAKAAAAELSRQQLSCIDSGPRAVTSSDADDSSQFNTLVQKIQATCKAHKQGLSSFDIRIDIDRQGKVSRVRSASGKSEPYGVLKCVRRALKGLRFPCLRHNEVKLTYTNATKRRSINLGDFL